MSERIDSKKTRSNRLLELFMKLWERRMPIPYAEFSEEEWGNERTFRRIRNELNELWQRRYGRRLFAVVDSDGQETDRGERFLKVIDPNIKSFRAQRLVAFPAYLEMMRLLQGTILEQSFRPIYDEARKDLENGERQYLEKAEKKFFYFGKGMKSYDSEEKTEILDEVYDSLVGENLLSAKVPIKGEATWKILRPLTLVMFNNGLYLQAQFEEDESGKVYKFKIDSFAEAKSLKDSPFKYPATHDPQEHFRGHFGLISSDTHERTEVVLEFARDPAVEAYVQERQWTENDRLERNEDGVLVLRMEAVDLREIKSFVLSFGPKVKVLRPESLKEEVLGSLQEAQRLYSA